MQRVGIADLGSNTARLVVYEYEPQRRYRMLEAIREPVRLGEGLAERARLTPAAIGRALAAVELFEDYAAASSLDALEILATSAVREAENRDEVLEPILRNGYSVRVVTGEEEAELGVLAVANGFALEDAWVIDLGGGSAQLSRMAERAREIAQEALRLAREEYRISTRTFEDLRTSFDSEATTRRQVITARHSFVDALLPLVQEGQVAHAAQRVGMLVSEHTPLDFERVNIKRLGVVVPVLNLVQGREVDHGDEGLGVLGSE